MFQDPAASCDSEVALLVQRYPIKSEVVYGMLAGIGVLIVLSQLHVMLDGTPKPSGLDKIGRAHV